MTRTTNSSGKIPNGRQRNGSEPVTDHSTKLVTATATTNNTRNTQPIRLKNRPRIRCQATSPRPLGGQGSSDGHHGGARRGA
jgi:hypothetical protein